MDSFTHMAQALESKGYALHAIDDDRVVLYPPAPQIGKSTIYRLSKGFFLIFNEVRSGEWPTMPTAFEDHTIIFNYCLSGRCEMNLDSGIHLFIEPSHLSLGTQHAVEKFLYPTKSYDGVEIMVDLNDYRQTPAPFLQAFDIDPATLVEKFHADKHAFICETNEDLERCLQTIWSLRDSDDINQQRFLCVELFLQLGNLALEKKRHTHYFTSSQLKVANQAAKIIEQDLSERVTIADLAERLGVCSTSLKDYFKGVHGCTLSAYVHEKRMQMAAQLLESSQRRKIAEVALSVGYENQGKFAAAFKAYYGMTPLAYRRMKTIQGAENKGIDL